MTEAVAEPKKRGPYKKSGAFDRRTIGGIKAAVDPGVNPLVREFFAHMIKRRFNCRTFGEYSGLDPATLSNWRHRKMPNVGNFEAALNALGLKLAIVPMEDGNAD